MEKTRGIVMRTSPKVTVIYTQKGDFLEIPTPKEPPVLGQTIEVNLNPRHLFSFHNSTLKYGAVAAILLMVLSISVFSLLFIPNRAVASVALDINHNKGVVLSLNKDGKVIKGPKVNDGLSVLTGINPQGLDVYQTVDLIIDNANHKGMLNETQNLVLLSVIPLNNREPQMIDLEKLRNTIHDAMTHRNLSGSVVVSQANQKIQLEALQQGMTVNGYLIYTRSQNKGIAVQADTLRQDVQKAMVDANVTVVSLFPEESFVVSGSMVQKNPQAKLPSSMGSGSSSMGPSSNSTPSNGMNPSAPSHPPVKQPMQGTSPAMNKPSSSPVSPGTMPKSSTPQPPMTPSNGGMGH